MMPLIAAAIDTYWTQACLFLVSELSQDFALCRVVLPAYGAGPYLPAIVMERPVYVREMSDGLYSPLTYLVYKVRMQCLYPDNQQLSPECLPDLSVAGEATS